MSASDSLPALSIWYDFALIPAGAVVGALDADGRRFTMVAGPGVTAASALANATATGGITLTGTYNDGTNYYNILQLNRPFVQGRIT